MGHQVEPKGAEKKSQVQGGSAEGEKETFGFSDDVLHRSIPMNWKASRSLRDSQSGCRLLISTEERSPKRSLKMKTELLASLRSNPCINFLFYDNFISFSKTIRTVYSH